MIEVFAKLTPIAIFNRAENFEFKLIELKSNKEAIEVLLFYKFYLEIIILSVETLEKIHVPEQYIP